MDIPGTTALNKKWQPIDKQEKTVNMDENEFFRNSTIRICSSLDIETALGRCYEYIKDFIPLLGMNLHILDTALNVLHFVASVGEEGIDGFEKLRLKRRG